MLFLVLGFLCALVASGASESNQTTCLSCSAPGNCQEITCPAEKNFCLVNYTGSDSDIMNNPCMDEQTCQEYIQNNTLNSTYCCQGNCSESTTVPETTSTPSSTITVTGSNTCYSCPDSGPCEAFVCPVGKDTCLSTVEVIGLGKNQSTFRRNGSCVAPEDCQPQFYSLSYEYQLHSWVNVTCCSGDCSDPPGSVDLPPGIPSDVLCPTCSLDEASCDESLYLLCFQGETSCVNMNLLQLGGGSTLTIQGCGSEDLCQLTENDTLGLGYQLISRPDCSSTRQAVLGYKCQQNAATCLGCGLLVPALLGLWMAAWLA